MLVRGDGSTVGLVSGGCLESDLAEHARRVHGTGATEIVRYDTRDDDDAPWGLGLGCNGLIEVLLEPLGAGHIRDIAALIDAALSADNPSVLVTVIRASADDTGHPSLGAHALVREGKTIAIGNWGDSTVLRESATAIGEALAAGRRGLTREYGATEIAFEVVMPSVRLVICGSGQDALPLAHFATRLGWDVTVVDHRSVTDAHAARFAGAGVIHCEEAGRLADILPLNRRTAAVVMSHHYSRDLDYVQALLAADVAYIGVLGPRARTERMLGDLAGRGAEAPNPARLFAPVGLDIGGDGPEAIALAVIAEVSAVAGGRSGGHLRSKKGPLHSPVPTIQPSAG